MGSHYIQVKLTRAQAEAMVRLLDDELSVAEPYEKDRASLEAARRIVRRGLQSLDARLSRMRRIK